MVSGEISSLRYQTLGLEVELVTIEVFGIPCTVSLIRRFKRLVALS